MLFTYGGGGTIRQLPVSGEEALSCKFPIWGRRHHHFPYPFPYLFSYQFSYFPITYSLILSLTFANSNFIHSQAKIDFFFSLDKFLK